MDTSNIKEQVRTIAIPPELRQRVQLGLQQAESERQANSRRMRKRIVRRNAAVAAIIGLCLLSAALMNQTRVWAAIQKALQFIPGIGMVNESSAQSDRYMLKQPISLSIGEGTILITGILTDNEMTYITMAGKETPQFDEITVVNSQGTQYNLSRSFALWGSSGDWTASFRHKGKLDVKGKIKLVLHQDPDIEVSAHLEKAESYSSYAELGKTATVNGITITAITDRIEEKARVSLVSPPMEGFSISDYGIHAVYLHDENHKLHIIDRASGEKVPIERIPGVGAPASDFYFPLRELKEDAHYTLTLPEISVTYWDEVSVKLPTVTQEHMDKTFQLAGFPVTVTKTEKIAPNSLRVYFDLHYSEQAASSLILFDLDGLSSMTKLNEQTGAIEYIEFAIKPGSKQVTLKLTRPEAVIRGPWTFDLQM